MVRCFVLLTCLHVCRGVLGLCDDQTLKGQRPKDINGFETSCQWILIACTEANLCASISPVPFGPWGWRLRRGRGRWARGCRTGRSTPTPTATTGMTSAPENEQTCTSAITTVWALDREHVRTHVVWVACMLHPINMFLYWRQRPLLSLQYSLRSDVSL